MFFWVGYISTLDMIEIIHVEKFDLPRYARHSSIRGISYIDFRFNYISMSSPYNLVNSMRPIPKRNVH